MLDCHDTDYSYRIEPFIYAQPKTSHSWTFPTTARLTAMGTGHGLLYTIYEKGGDPVMQ